MLTKSLVSPGDRGLQALPLSDAVELLALLHLGGTRIFGVLLTMDGKQGVEAIRVVNPEIAVPIHYNDYDVFKSPLEDFRSEVRAAGLESRIRYVAHGRTILLPPPTRKGGAPGLS